MFFRRWVAKHLRYLFCIFPQGFQNPHALAVTRDGMYIYETELSEPYRVYKMRDYRVEQEGPEEEDGDGGGFNVSSSILLVASASIFALAGVLY